MFQVVYSSLQDDKKALCSRSSVVLVDAHVEVFDNRTMVRLKRSIVFDTNREYR